MNSIGVAHEKPTRPPVPGLVGGMRALIRDRRLILRLTRREIEGRFRGSFLGLAWVVINPLLMLGVYTFVFTVMFKARWQTGDGRTGEFALHVFSGLLTFGIFSESVSRAPNLIIENSNYVKKVVFPLEVLSCVIVGAALFNALIGFGIFFLGFFLLLGPPPLSALLLPLVMSPLIFFTLGACWFLSALGVFVRDVRYLVTVAISVLMFMSPIFYPASAFPEKLRVLMLLNPLAPVLDAVKGALFDGNFPDPIIYAGGLSVSVLATWVGYTFFMITKRAFADVI